jgi:hypothetical protein
MKTLLILLIFVTPVFAVTDFKCMQICLENGYQYMYCNSKCDYNVDLKPKLTDFKCMQECSSKGYSYTYCNQNCSY